MSTYRKKLIEVALPLDAINTASAREKSIRHGHPSTLHLWWARRPLATARAVIFAQMVDDEAAKKGTKLARGANFRCLMSETPIAPQYIKDEGKAGRMGARLMAIVAEGDRGRVYLAPTPEMEAITLTAKPTWKPEMPLPADMRSHWTPPYGLTTYGDLFTPRQLVALTTFSDLVQEARERVKQDALAAGLSGEAKPLRDGVCRCGSGVPKPGRRQDGILGFKHFLLGASGTIPERYLCSAGYSYDMGLCGT